MASIESPSQPEQALAPASNSSTLPTSNMGAKRVAKQSPKRSREEVDDDDEEDAFGTPPPKRAARSTSLATKGKTATKKMPASKKPAPKKGVAKKAAKKPATAATPSSRPSRNRKAPERFEEFEEKPTPEAVPTKKGTSKVFDPVYITTNSSSRLVKADIYVS